MTTASIAITAPRTYEPTLQINILAGKILKYKKGIIAPTNVAQKPAKELYPRILDNIQNEMNEIKARLPAKPSSPSVKATAFKIPMNK